MPLKIVFFVSSLDSGGIENYLLRFLQYKSDSFREIHVYCKSGRGGQLEEKYRDIVNLKIIKNHLGFFSIKKYLALRSYLKDERFDAVCDFTGNFAGLPLLTAKKAGVPRRIAFYRGATDHFKATLFKKLYNDFVKKLTVKNATSILSNSRAALVYFFGSESIDNGSFKVIYNGIDASKFDAKEANLRSEFGIPGDAFIIGHTGRFNYAKNHEIILQVAAKITSKYHDIFFILCGNGVRDNLQVRVDLLGLSGKILLFENRDDIPRFLNTMNVYFFPSITEGQPNALIEAMVMGIPFVASNIKPIEETVGEFSENLFPPDDIEGFTNALEKLYHRKEKRNEALKVKMGKTFDYRNRFEEFYEILVK